MVTRTMVFGQDNWPTDYGDNNAGMDHVTGTSAPNTIDGGTGNDTIDGRAGDDIITGGRGSDQLTGGPGHDTFIYTHVLDSPANNPDTITDFKPSEDAIDLHRVDADVTKPGDQDFNFIFDQPFSHVAGELRIDPNTGTMEGDVDGNGTADLLIHFGSEVPDGGGNVAFFTIGGHAPAVHHDVIF